MTNISVKQLGNRFMIFGNKGNVWSNTAHAYKLGTGNLCGTPALSSNYAAAVGVHVVGCPECLKVLEHFGVKKV